MGTTQQPPLNGDQLAARYPQHQKFTKEVSRDVMLVQDFIMWLQGKGIELCQNGDGEEDGDTYSPLVEPRKLAFTWKGIDYDQLFREKMQMRQAEVNEKQ